MVVERTLGQSLIDKERSFHIKDTLYANDQGLLLHNRAALIAKVRYGNPQEVDLHVYCDRSILVVSRRVAELETIDGLRKPFYPGIGDMRWFLLDRDERTIYIGDIYEVGFRRNGEGISVRIESTEPFNGIVYVPRQEIIEILKSANMPSG